MASPSHHRPSGWKRPRRNILRNVRLPANWKIPKIPKGAWKTVFLALACLFIAGTIGILALFAYVSRDLPDPNALTERSIAQSTKIYDRTGEHLLYEIHGEENRTLAKMQEGFCEKGDEALSTDPNGIPLMAVQATIAAEDHKFCTHHGFSYTGLLRAVVFGGSRGGGSTLTQQLVKNAILSNEQTLIRKAKELILSLALERRYTKDEILQIYFNEIPYGSTYYGIQAASQNYFGKSVKDLSLAQAATLAALPQAPTSHLNNPDRLLTRRNWILDQMVELGFAEKDAVEAAKAEETPVKVNVSNITAPHFVFYVKEQLEATYGSRRVAEGGLKVTTTIDLEKQKMGEEAVVAQVEANGEGQGFTNASLVAIDPKNGQILAMVGSKDYFDDEIDGQVNVSTRPRQPGSSIKPIVYAKAFENGFTPNTVLWDVKTNFPTETGTYAPNNYDLKERGPVRLRDALQTSLNIPAVKTLLLVGVQNALDFAEGLGYTTFGDRSRFGPAIVLGGGEVFLLEHVNAYAAFANDGVHFPPVSILKVEDPDGTTLEEWKVSDGQRAMDANTARMVSNVLSDNAARVPVFGAGSALQLGGRPVAAKTGTTNDYHDAWTVGYTPSLVAGVWAGNNNNDPMNRAGGSLAAAPIWNSFMRKALEGTPVESFTFPQIPLTGKAVLDGKLESQTVVVDRASGKLATEYTPVSMREERTYAQYHEILQYVDPHEPRGDAPAHPESHPQYAAWEAGVADWLLRRETETGVKITQGAVPTEFDDVHMPANAPRVRLTSPSDGAQFPQRVLSVSADVDAPRGIRRVDFYLDGFFLGSDASFPYVLSANIPASVSRGYHTLKAVAYDDVDNAGSDSVGITVDSDPSASGFEILDPKNGQTIERSSDSFTVVVSLGRPSDYRFVTVYAQPSGNGDRQVIGGKLNPDSPFLTFTWGLPSEGEWILQAEGELLTGEHVTAAGAIVRIVKPTETGTPQAPPEGETPPETPPSPLLPLDPFAGTTAQPIP